MKAIMKAIAMTFGAMVLTTAPAAFAFSTYETSMGHLVRWNRTEITVTLDEKLALIGDMDEIENTVAEAFDDWVDSASLPVEFKFVRGSCDADGYDKDAENVNCITADDSFFGLNQDAAATTLLSFADESGEIKDADIVLREQPGLWSNGSTTGKQSLRRALLHETGHFLGMSHSEVEAAIMYPTMDSSEDCSSSDLHDDDLDGASYLYEGFAPKLEMMCSTTSVGAGNGPAPLALIPFGALAMFLIASRRRNR